MDRFYQRLRQQIDSLFIYIKEDDSADPNQFSNTCVLDSLLAALHIAYTGYPNIADLLNGDDFFRHVSFLFQQKRFPEARRSCVAELGHGKVDLFGHVKEYFPLIDKLVWPENPPNDSEITRIFQLQCMLLGKENHMTMPSFHHFSFDMLKNMDICFTGYVNITQAQEYKLGDVPYLLSNITKISIVLVANLKMEQFYQRLRQRIDSLSIYIKEDDSADPNQFINTCVLDSLLAALHMSYIGYPNIADLLNGDDFFRHAILLFQQKCFPEARRFCVGELGHEKVDLFGHVKEYFPLIDKLVWPENPPNDSEITRKLKEFGGVIVLGNPSDPPLILVHPATHDGLSKELPHYVNDDEKKRIFARIFLLIGKDKHMTMCFRCPKESWLLYDNNPKIPPFQPFNVNILKDYIICLAGYVNVTQALEYKLGVAETGEVANLSNVAGEPFDPQLSALVAKMENLSLTNPVSETGEGVGTRPFVENVEMLSSSSCDSE